MAKEKQTQTKKRPDTEETDLPIIEEELEDQGADENEKTEDQQESKGACQKEKEALENRLLRLQADFDNFRKRVQRERVELYQRANEDLFSALLPSLDHFEIGLKTAQEQNAHEAVTQGFQLVYDELKSFLKKFNVEPIDAEDQSFDPHLHEAMTHVPSEEKPVDVVIQQTRRGYKMGDKLLRAAQVVVSSGPGNEPEDTNAP